MTLVAQLGLARLFWPGLTQLLLMSMASAMTTEMLWLPSTCLSHLPGGSPGHVLKTISKERRQAEAHKGFFQPLPVLSLLTAHQPTQVPSSTQIQKDKAADSPALGRGAAQSSDQMDKGQGQKDKAADSPALVRGAAQSSDQMHLSREGWGVRVLNTPNIPQAGFLRDNSNNRKR